MRTADLSCYITGERGLRFVSQRLLPSLQFLDRDVQGEVLSVQHGTEAMLVSQNELKKIRLAALCKQFWADCASGCMCGPAASD